jgi:hypothetical protein
MTVRTILQVRAGGGGDRCTVASGCQAVSYIIIFLSRVSEFLNTTP